MARPELGVKRICPTTGKKFYDLNRDPIVSPYTGEVLQRAMFEPVARRGSAAPKAAPVQAEEEDTELENSDVELVSLEEADDEAAAPGGKAAPADDDDLDVEVEDDGNDDDAFLEEDEDEGDDVSDLIGDGIENDDEQ